MIRRTLRSTITDTLSPSTTLGRALRGGEGPVVGTYDVVVCGGGPAGLIAAVAAARSGAETLLIERYGFLGGMSTSALVTPISEFRHFGKQHIGGIPFELLRDRKNVV